MRRIERSFLAGLFSTIFRRLKVSIVRPLKQFFRDRYAPDVAMCCCGECKPCRIRASNRAHYARKRGDKNARPLQTRGRKKGVPQQRRVKKPIAPPGYYEWDRTTRDTDWWADEPE